MTSKQYAKLDIAVQMACDDSIKVAVFCAVLNRLSEECRELGKKSVGIKRIRQEIANVLCNGIGY